MTRAGRWLDRLAVGVLIRRAAVLGSGAAIGQIAVVLATPFLAHIYDPADFGVLAVFLAVSGVAVVVSALRYEQAILVAENDDEASAVVRTAGVCVVGSVVAASVAALAGGGALARFTSTPEIGDLLWLLPITVALGGIQQIMVAWATRIGAFGALARSKAVLGVSLGISQLVLGLVVEGSIGLLAGVALSWAMAIITLLPVMRNLRLATDTAAWTAAKRYRHFPQFGMWASLLNRGALEIPAVALAAIYGPEVAGAFLLANRVVTTPTRLITESAYQVYVNEASRLQREAPSDLALLFRRTLTRLALLAVPLALVLAVLGPTGFAIVFGDEWAASADYVRLLAPVLVAMMLTQPVAGTLWIMERLDLQLIREVARVGFVALAFVVAWALGFGANAAVMAYAVGMVAGYSLLLALCRSVLVDSDREPVVAVSVP